MKNKEWKEIFKKYFGKEKDSRYHAIAMLIIYSVFIIALVAMIRVFGGSVNSLNESNNNTTTSSPTTNSTFTPDIENDVNNENKDINTNDINYSYSYTVTYNGITEVYIGKKIDEKEKFTLVKDGINNYYAILDDNYLILDNGIYRITDNPSKYFKYCDVEKILLLIENEIPTENDGTVKYVVSNQSLVKLFNDILSVDNEQNNFIQLYLSDGVLKSIDLDFSNYLTSIDGNNVTLTIHMEFADVGTTEDFEINVVQ